SRGSLVTGKYAWPEWGGPEQPHPGLPAVGGAGPATASRHPQALSASARTDTRPADRARRGPPSMPAWTLRPDRSPPPDRGAGPADVLHVGYPVRSPRGRPDAPTRRTEGRQRLPPPHRQERPETRPRRLRRPRGARTAPSHRTRRIWRSTRL